MMTRCVIRNKQWMKTAQALLSIIVRLGLILRQSYQLNCRIVQLFRKV